MRLKIVLPPLHRSALAKFRCGVAPLRIETGRYEHLPELQRTCPFCSTNIENELHVLLECSMYNSIRQTLFDVARTIEPNFELFTIVEKYVFLFTQPDRHLVRSLAKACCEILKTRNNVLFSK